MTWGESKERREQRKTVYWRYWLQSTEGEKRKSIRFLFSGGVVEVLLSIFLLKGEGADAGMEQKPRRLLSRKKTRDLPRGQGRLMHAERQSRGLAIGCVWDGGNREGPGRGGSAGLVGHIGVLCFFEAGVLCSPSVSFLRQRERPKGGGEDRRRGEDKGEAQGLGLGKARGVVCVCGGVREGGRERDRPPSD